MILIRFHPVARDASLLHAAFAGLWNEERRARYALARRQAEHRARRAARERAAPTAAARERR